MNRKTIVIVPIIIFSSGFLIYSITAYPTITWWDASEYSAAAVCFGLTGAPGSIIMTALGWFVSWFTSNNPAFFLNLLAGFIGSLAVVFSFLVFEKLIKILSESEKPVEFSVPEYSGLILASIIVICSTSLWEYSIMFTPYILTALFTMFILYSVLIWWENAFSKASWKQLFLVTLLIGIDFSVHRTNAVLIPGIIIVMLIRNYRFLFNYKSYLAAFGGLILGLSIQLLYIPMSLNNPALNMGETNNMQRWWSFISLEQYGGNFLTDIFVRKGPLLSYQIPYYLKGFANNFFYFSKTTIVFGYIPDVLGLIGIIFLFRKNRKLAISLLTFFFVTIIISIVYFNLPENYFRTIYRHYLPTYIIFSVFIFSGVFYLFRLISKFGENTRKFAVPGILVLILITAFTQFDSNYTIRNGSGNTIAYDHSKNILKSVEKDGIIFSYWDNNYFAPLYVQIGDHFRPDITQCNLSLLNLDWYIQQQMRHDKNFPFRGKSVNIDQIEYKNWETEHYSCLLNETIKKKYNAISDTFRLSLPALRQENSNLLQDLVLYDIIKNNEWKRPLYFVKQGMEGELLNWLKPYLSDEGLIYKLVPDSSNQLNIAAIEKNLDNFKISAYNNHSVYLDDISRRTGNLYYELYISLIRHKLEKDNKTSATQYFSQMTKALPVNRLQPEAQIIEEIKMLENLIKK